MEEKSQTSNLKPQTSYEWGEGVFTLLSWFKKDKVKKHENFYGHC